MKKLSLLLVCMMLSLTFVLTGCGSKTDDNVIRVNEVTHSIFYAPMYIAMTQGYFEDEGYEIELTNGGGADLSMAALASKTADIGLMGVEAAIYTHKQGKADLPVVFGQLTRCDGSFIVGRDDTPFDYAEMENKTILGGRKGGMPAMVLEYVLKQNGLIDGKNITIRYDIAFNLLTSAFAGGEGDYVTAFEPTASLMESEGKGYVKESVGKLSGDVPFTAFMANQSYLDENTDKIEAFLRAVAKGYEFLTTKSIDEVVKALKPQFATTTDALLKAGIQSYIDINAWSKTMELSEQSYNNLINIMLEADELDSIVSYDDVIDNSFVENILED